MDGWTRSKAPLDPSDVSTPVAVTRTQTHRDSVMEFGVSGGKRGLGSETGSTVEEQLSGTQ